MFRGMDMAARRISSGHAVSEGEEFDRTLVHIKAFVVEHASLSATWRGSCGHGQEYEDGHAPL